MSSTRGRGGGRHRRPPSRAGRLARTLGPPTVSLPLVLLMLIFCQSPPSWHDTTASSQAATSRSTGYPMPSALAVSPGSSSDVSGDRVPIGALATAAAASPSPASTVGSLVGLAGGERRIPLPVLTAYQQAAATLAGEQPACHLRWQLLAGIGKVESGNASGRQISADGTVTPTILGPRLTGHGGFARITDTDHGTLDHDTTYDRAVGPLQFLPSTWASAGRDGNADHRRDPNNIHDAALTAGGYLCAHHRDLANPAQLTAAIRAYNPSDAYIRAVLAWTTGYTTSTPTPVAVTTSAGATSPAGRGPASDPYPVFALTPVQTTPATPSNSPAAADCAPITITTSSLTAVITTGTLDLTGLYTTASTNPNPNGTISVHTIARDPTGQTLATTDRPLPLRPGDLPAVLTQLPLDRLTDPGHTASVTIVLTVAPPGCPGRTLTSLTITNITRPASTLSPTSPTATTSPTAIMSARPTPRPTDPTR
ncbi:lytic transglycosylase domain-containing protein [Pseudofrankia sp. DC12]|uniref:lytic transglycosylase domain-containing protein n=1 Tax=Pseudofrankia sp. DC12 TaxID=683315 RepID=UPI001E636956|nr:lytic transglycosylase domain-containing protein [Pseudofrankia sp. DC12]